MSLNLVAVLALMAVFIGIALTIKRFGKLEEREKVAAEVTRDAINARKIDDQVAHTDADDIRSDLMRQFRREKSLRDNDESPPH